VLPTRSQTSNPPAAHSGHDHAQMQAGHSEHTQMMCKQMMADHVAEMKATSQTLATNLAQMQATLPLINDLNERSRWQSNIAMWQAVADHFSHMAEHAAHMQGMGMGCGMMMGHSPNSEDKPAAPAKAQ
jgi:hypothetical protein